MHYCRDGLGVLDPDKYILPDYPKSRNMNENHIFYDKIQIFKRKSKSADVKKRELRPITPSIPITDIPERSKSAYLGKKIV